MSQRKFDRQTRLIDALPEMIRESQLLARVMRLYDDLTASHQVAVRSLSKRLALAAGLPKENAEVIGTAGAVHDIGKMAISRSIICKPTSLTQQEWVEMKLHPLLGESMLLGLPALVHIAPIVRSHHERADGRGYPDGLSLAEIPLESRIIAVADAFHAMTVVRPYSRPRSVTDALRELESNSGSQFDPDVVEVFVRMLAPRATLDMTG